eukprot:Pgem_evm1s9039
MGSWILIRIDLAGKRITLFPTTSIHNEEDQPYVDEINLFLVEVQFVFDELYYIMGDKDMGNKLPFFKQHFIHWEETQWKVLLTPILYCPTLGSINDSCARMLSIIKYLVHFYIVDPKGLQTSSLPVCHDVNNSEIVIKEVEKGQLLYLPFVKFFNDDDDDDND